MAGAGKVLFPLEPYKLVYNFETRSTASRLFIAEILCASGIVVSPSIPFVGQPVTSGGFSQRTVPRKF